jgi:membrane protein implicated in regulation of membrane protease activity
VAGSTLLTESSSEELRTRRQGFSDFTMSIVGGLGAIIAGAVLGWIGYGGLALVVLVLVAASVLLAPLGWRASRARPAGQTG